MAANQWHSDHELVVASDGSIPAYQLARLGVGPGAHLRVVETPAARPGGSFAGSLPNFPELSWEDFERASKLAREDVGDPGQRTGGDDLVSAAPPAGRG